MGLVRFPWWENGDSFDVAMVVNRLLTRGVPGCWLTADAAGAGAPAGDFVLDLDAATRAAAEACGLRLAAFSGKTDAEHALPLAPARIALFSGTASKYPYDAYYGLALLRLGYDFEIVDGPAIAAGALRRANVLVIPGGFATWGIDAAEGCSGADAQVRAFLARGGGALGSCGGAFYLSAGRPGWTGTADAKPLYNHEYLQSGVGLLEIALAPGPLTLGCPPALDVPYYHGPIYGAVGGGTAALATFANFILPGGVAIANPLDRDLFEREMKGRPAALVADNARGRAVLFSPHPEMGDLVRKYIAFDGYVRKYLPIRGRPTMHDTLRHYRVADAPSFRLIANALAWLAREEPPEPPRTQEAAAPASVPAELSAHVLRRLAALDLAGRTDDEQTLTRALIAGLQARAAALAESGAAGHAGGRAALAAFAAAALARLAQEAPLAQELMEIELALTLSETALRLGAVDRMLDEAR